MCTYVCGRVHLFEYVVCFVYLCVCVMCESSLCLSVILCCVVCFVVCVMYMFVFVVRVVVVVVVCVIVCVFWALL